MRFKNFEVWRGRLPHWRADDVTYYVTFRHRRELEASERQAVLRALLRPDARKWNLLIVCVLPEATELIVTAEHDFKGAAYELSDVVERAKTKAAKEIVKRSGERFPPFYTESYDRIIRDEVELEERWNAILESSVAAELAEDPEDYDALYVAERTIETPMPDQA